MGVKHRVLLSWSSGKDSAWALHELSRQDDLEVVGLLTTFDTATDSVPLHGVPRSLVEAQAHGVGLSLYPVFLAWPCPNVDYEVAVKTALLVAKDKGITALAFGDLFLSDIRAYREQMLQDSGLALLFPLWGQDTAALANTMVSGGLRARIVALDPSQAPRDIIGQIVDAELLRQLPPQCDPCGENGEFHTFVEDGPMFRTPVVTRSGPVREEDGFLYIDMHPQASPY
jgi:uncharacterized protein (TIGR00290 family)